MLYNPSPFPNPIYAPLLYGVIISFFFYYSDIDLVICGRWQNLPLYTLYDELVKSQISKSDDIVVLDKAAVSITHIFCKYVG